MTEIEHIKKTIRKQCHLQGEGLHWQLNEQPTVKLRAPTCHSIGFSVDNPDNPQYHPLTLFSKSPPSDISKRPDAILVLKWKQTIYWFIVEQKTHRRAGYEKQLINGKYFCDWLIALHRHHGYLNCDSVCVGLLVWQPRPKFVSKGTTSHRGNRPSAIAVDTFSYSFEVKNIPDISLIDVLQAINRTRLGGKP